MSINQASSELSELKEWLTNEVKLERYFDKLTNYGFGSLSLIQNLEESDLDSVGITPPYHRKRMLKFCKDLQMKQSPHVNKECAQTGNDPTESAAHEQVSLVDESWLPRPPERNEDSEYIIDHSNEEDGSEPPPPPLPPKSGDVSKAKPVAPDRESSLPHQPTDYNTESNTQTTSATAELSKTEQAEAMEPDLPPITLLGLDTNTSTFSEGKDVKIQKKKPPPIPQRSDLEPEEDKIYETNEDNEQSDLTKDIGTSEDSNVKMPYIPEKVSAPKPVPRRRRGSKEKPLNTQSSQPKHSTDETNGNNSLVKDAALHSEEHTQSKEIKAQSEEDDEPIYGNKDECRQAVAAPVKEMDKPANKKPLPLPRVKPRQKLAQQAVSDRQNLPVLPDRTKQDFIRHSIAVTDHFANQPDEEEKATQFKNGRKHTKSLPRSNKFPPVSDPENFKNPSLAAGSTTTSTSIQPSQPKPVSPPVHIDEQDTYEVIGGVPKDDKGNCMSNYLNVKKNCLFS